MMPTRVVRVSTRWSQSSMERTLVKMFKMDSIPLSCEAGKALIQLLSRGEKRFGARLEHRPPNQRHDGVSTD
jgi:hypothetical protein